MNLTGEELAKVVRKRRLELGRTQVAVVDAANEAFGTKVLSEPTYRTIETGRGNPSDLTLSAVSRGLDWPADALQRIRAGQWTYIDQAAMAIDAQEPKVSSSDDVDWAELAELDPEGYATLMAQARLLRDRARGDR